MSYLDIIIAIPLIWGAFNGFRKGFIIEVASLIALIAGIYGAVEFSYLTGGYLSGQFDWSPRIIQMMAFCLTFAIIVLVVHLIARSIQRLVKMAALGTVNRIFGLLFGLIKYLFVIAVLIYLVDAINQRYPFISEEMRSESLLFDPLTELVRSVYPKIEGYLIQQD